MRTTYRSKHVDQYWTMRWDNVEIDSPMSNKNAYPLKFALSAVSDRSQNVLEAGCGAGRILRFFHNNSYRITGFDYVQSVVRRLKEIDPTLNIDSLSITDLPYPDNTYDVILAFGLYHNLETGLDKALSETHRVMVPGGTLCASFRANNLQTLITDLLAARKEKRRPSSQLYFHKNNIGFREYRELLINSGFTRVKIYPVENMPFLYKFRFFRHTNHKSFNEGKGRNDGYRLSFIGQFIQYILIHLLPMQWCNIYVAFAHKDD